MNYNHIVWPENFTEEQKEIFKKEMDWNIKEKQNLCVIYTPDCNCSIEFDVVLDRYPMSEKIISSCPACHKGVHLEISDPIRFYLPMLKKEYSLEDIKKSYITDTWQKDYISYYQNE